MIKSVSEIAKELGFDRYSFSEVFETHYSEKEIIEKLSEGGICTNVDELRKRLEYAGKKCTLYEGLIVFLEKGINKAKDDIEHNVGDTFAEEKWLNVIQTHRNVYEMMGFLTLLQMDALTTIICLVQAPNDTERIMLCKHAYTIIYEALEKNFPKKVSFEMRMYPEDIVNKGELDSFWKEINGLFKKMINKKEAGSIRHKLDAHKDKSFTTQIALYKKCDWAVSVVILFGFVKIIDTIQLYMDNIHQKLCVLYDQYRTFMEERTKQYEDILRQLREYQESPYE